MATAYHLDRAPLPTAAELGERLATLRKGAGLDHHDVAIRAKVDEESVRAFESDGVVTGDDLIRLVEAFSADRTLDDAFRKMATEEDGLDTIGGILHSWSRGRIDSAEAMRHARLECFADLLEAAIDNEVPIPTATTPEERADAHAIADMIPSR